MICPQGGPLEGMDYSNHIRVPLSKLFKEPWWVAASIEGEFAVGRVTLIFQSFWASVAERERERERECFVKMEFASAFLSQKKSKAKLRLLRHSYLKDRFSWVVSFLMQFIFFPIYITTGKII